MRAITTAQQPCTARRRRRPFDYGVGRRRRAPLPPPTAARASLPLTSSSSAIVPFWLDNAAAQSAVALDVEYAHYELWEEGDEQRLKQNQRRKAAVSVPAAVAVVARGDSSGVATQPPGDWRSGLQVLYHAPYIEPELELEEEHISWRWVGGVKRPEASPLDPQTTLATARTNVLSALTNRSTLILHGADHDLRALGLLSTLDQPNLIILDTAALPPLTHPRSGGPVSLKRLASQFLNREIQAQNELHDPVEDAAAALDLWLDVAWPRVLLDRQVGVGVVGESEAAETETSAAAMLVAALEATLAREMAQGRRLGKING